MGLAGWLGLAREVTRASIRWLLVPAGRSLGWSKWSWLNKERARKKTRMRYRHNMDETDARMILGVGPDADFEECKRGYRNAIRVWHSDVRAEADEADATRAAQRVNEAWAVLQEVFSASASGLGSTPSSSEPGDRGPRGTPNPPRATYVMKRRPARAWWVALGIAGIVLAVTYAIGTHDQTSTSSSEAVVLVSEPDTQQWAVSEADPVVASQCSDGMAYAKDVGMDLRRFSGVQEKKWIGSYVPLWASKPYEGWRSNLRKLSAMLETCSGDGQSTLNTRAKNIAARASGLVPPGPPAISREISCSEVTTYSDASVFGYCEANPYATFRGIVIENVPPERVRKIHQAGRQLVRLANQALS